MPFIAKKERKEGREHVKLDFPLKVECMHGYLCTLFNLSVTTGRRFC